MVYLYQIKQIRWPSSMSLLGYICDADNLGGNYLLPILVLAAAAPDNVLKLY